MSDIQVRGYSERGMINSFCYEIRYSPNGLKLLRDLLGLCTFPSEKPDFTHFRSATMIIEQSFSDFGDLDLLILLEGQCTQAICIEAKVKTFHAKQWSLERAWSTFQSVQSNDEHHSNLFVQLYRKMRLLKKVANMDEELAADALAKRWSLGTNKVIRNAAQALSKNCSEGWMIALVPDSKANTHAFFESGLSSPPPGLPDWQHTHFGYLTWEEFFAHCCAHADEWPETLANFEYNQGQIFGIPTVVWDSPTGPQRVTVKKRGSKNSRILLEDGTERLVPNTKLRE